MSLAANTPPISRPKTALLCLALAGGLALPALAAPDPSGVWARGDGNARVRIAPCGENICATNLWIKDTSQGEEVGDVLVMTLKPSSGTVLEGKAYDRKRQLNYSMTLTLEQDGMTTRGCIIGGMVCKTVSWSRAG